MKVKLTADGWKTRQGAHVRGNAFLGGSCLDASDLAQRVSETKCWLEFVNLVQALNGFFAIVYEAGSGIYAATDRVRSMPLFYGDPSAHVHISDNVDHARHKQATPEPDLSSCLEFMAAGYVSGPDTLLAGVKQMKPAEIIGWNAGPSASFRMSSHSYHSIKSTPLARSYMEFMEELDEVVLDVFKRLIQYADGRCIVVPLSGGLDSRLVVVSLKRLRYDNVVTFSYGTPGNAEAQTSRMVSESLGYKWLFIPYSLQAWRKWYESASRADFFHYSSDLAMLPHIQDWPAVGQIRADTLVPDDSIFVPGHGADVMAGSRSFTNPWIYSPSRTGRGDVIKSIASFHYGLWPLTSKKLRLGPFLAERISSRLREHGIHPEDDWPLLFESWDFLERQPKFLVNSVRVYEYWGYDWWLPYWDLQFVEFWQRVPRRWRIAKRLYRRYVQTQFERTANGTACHWRIALPGLKLELKRYATMLRMREIKKMSLVRSKVRTEYRNHPLAWYGCVNPRRFDSLYTGHENIYSFLVLDVLMERIPEWCTSLDLTKYGVRPAE